MAEGQISEKVMSPEIEKWHRTNPINELLYSQKEVARFLELGYLALRDHPEVAAEIRNTAQEARTQHALTAGLFKKFVVTASNVVNTYCPIMLDAVELKDKNIVVEAFEQVLEMCLEMKKETEDARNSYLKIQNKVQQDLNKVNITNKNVQKKKMNSLELKKKYDEELVKEAEREQMELDKERKELKEKVKKIEGNRDEWLKTAAPPTSMREAAHKFIGTTIPTGAWVAGACVTGAWVAGPVGIAVGMAAGIGMNIWRNKVEAEQAIKASHEAHTHLTSTYEEKRKVDEKASEKRQGTLATLAHIEALNLQKASLGDKESLRVAVLQLGNVDKQFNKIISFCDSMATMLKHLHQSQRAGKIYLKKIEEKRYSDKFKLSVVKAKNTWNRIGIIWKNYVEGNDEVIVSIYGFLSSPVDNMTDAELKERKSELIKEIKDDAENSEN